MDFLSDNGGQTYNLCHCACNIQKICDRHSDVILVQSDWSNFEIADMDFWRGEAYQKFFEYLESTGGFYYEVRSCSTLASTSS